MNVNASPRLNRRSFVRTSAAVAAAGYFTSTAPALSQSANEKVNIACIGTANRAAANIAALANQAVVALCDVDANYLNAKEKEFPGARLYADYRELLQAEGDRIDAVVIGTTDHHHAPAAIRAIRAGKHVYCEKPLTHTVAEARLIAAETAKAGVATQMGIQIHAGDNYRRVVEIVQSGVLGPITEVHVWVGKGWGERPDFQRGPASDPPAHLDWDLWLGPAPERPYSAGHYHPAQWRKYWDFGQGTLGDMGCHFMDLPFWALGLRNPTEVSAEGPAVNAETAPLGLTVHYQFPARGDAPALKLTWYDGDQIPKRINDVPMKSNGVVFVGSEGMMFADYSSYRMFFNNKDTKFSPPPKSIPDSVGHHQEWVQAILTGSPTTCNFDYSGALSESVLLGNVAYRSGTAFKWDSESLTADNDAAQALVSKEYRAGWEVA